MYDLPPNVSRRIPALIAPASLEVRTWDSNIRVLGATEAAHAERSGAYQDVDNLGEMELLDGSRTGSGDAVGCDPRRR
jgi:hypothetical protein